MATTDIPHFTHPQFAPIRGELCRLFIARKTELGLAGRADVEIEAGVDDIAWYLLQRVAVAMHYSDESFLERYHWFVELVSDMLCDPPVQLHR